MPLPAMPPTPGSSTEIKPRDGSHIGYSQTSFELPPSAFQTSRPSSAETSSSASSYHPISPKTAPQPKRRSTTTLSKPNSTESNDAFTLPPPPSRSRKIIQMKPKGQGPVAEELEVGKNQAGKQAQGKKKQPSATSAAGRKIARKTAHSLIERRRRSKMNEEFGVLKNMIPACTGEMHKLAILQASIDYVRYLEDCVAKLKEQNNHSTPAAEQYTFTPPTARDCSYEDDGASDVEMAGSADPSPMYNPAPIPPHQQSISPVILAQDAQHYYRNNSYATCVSSDGRHYSYSSTNTSPAFGPQRYDYANSNASVGSTLTSPALIPQRDDRSIDHEATAALLMLNTDRRGTKSSERGRGMSVRDLLSA